MCRNPINELWKQVYIVLLTSLFFLLPSCTLFFLYFRLCRILLKTNSILKRAAVSSGSMNSTEGKHLKRQVFNIIACIVVVFFVCHLPLRVAGLWFTFEDKKVIFSLGLEKYLNILFSTRIMFYMNHALNPILYNIVSTKFRTALRIVCSLRGNKASATTTDRKRKHPFVSMKKDANLLHDCNTESEESRSFGKPKNRQSINDFYPGFCDIQGRHEESRQLSSRSCSPDQVDVQIKMHNTALSITFNLKRSKTH